MLCDSSASRGILQRIGAGKCRHIETKWLWIQQTMNEKKLATRAVKTEENVADIGTKPLDRERIEYLLQRMKMKLVVSAGSLGCQTRPSTISMLTLAMLMENVDAMTMGVALTTPPATQQTSSYTYLFMLVVIILMWEVSKSIMRSGSETFLKATGLRAKNKEKETTKQSKKRTRDVGVQAPCTYKFKWEQPRFVPLPEDSAGAFI